MSKTADLFKTLRDKPSADEMRAVFDRYRALMSAGDIDGICDLFAEDAEWEEPVGTVTEKGRAAIRARYENALAGNGGRIQMVADGAPRVAGHRAVAPSVATIQRDGVAVLIETANAIVCDENGKITEMKIYVGPSGIRPPPR